ncbi:MAG: tetratricopeptide repeat protein, partial [Sphingomonas bacterium]
INFPAPFRLSVTMRGPLAELIHAGAAQASKDELTEMAVKMSSSYLDSPIIVTRTLAFDEVAGTASLSVTGLSFPEWKKENELYRGTIDRAVAQINFEPDRTRPAWRSIPVATDDAHFISIRTKVHLPDNGSGFALEGNTKLSDTLAGSKLEQTATLANGWVTTDARMISTATEIAVADIGAERQRIDQAKQHLLRVTAPAAYPAPWQVVEASRKAHRFEPILAMFAQRIAAEPDKAESYTSRAWFYERIYERGRAIDDVTHAIAVDPSVDSFLWRARLYADVGDKDKAMADVLAARTVDPASGNAIRQLASLYADNGKKDQALTLLDTRIDEGGKDKPDFLSAKAEILGQAGDKDGALTTIDAAIASTPGNANLLNSRCWLKGTLGVMLDTALKDCTKSIELSDSPEGAMDSRAMVYFRLNRFDDALADLNAALDLNPQLPASMYMRGVIRKRMGDAKAAEGDLAAARMMSPQIDQSYAKYGIKP